MNASKLSVGALILILVASSIGIAVTLRAAPAEREPAAVLQAPAASGKAGRTPGEQGSWAPVLPARLPDGQGPGLATGPAHAAAASPSQG